MKKIFVFILLGLIRFYQFTFSNFLPPSCRFHPACSQYAIEAISKHGMFIGSYLSIKRVLRCHPLTPGGYDPVPETENKK